MAVIGCGRMGRHHARVFSTMAGVRLVGCYDVRPDDAAAVAREYGGQSFADLAELARHVDAVVIATPTSDHLAVARPLLEAGIACLIEKPLAPDAEAAHQIADLARRTNTPVQVGHIERFNPAVVALEKLQLKPAFMQATRLSPHPFRGLDVGVVLDMMIHDIDIVLKLANSPLLRCEAVGVSLMGNVEDACNARLTFASGCVADLTASRLALATQRRLSVFAREAYVQLDYQNRTGVVVAARGNLGAVVAAVQSVRSGQQADPSQLDYTRLVRAEALAVQAVDPLTAQAQAFVQAVRLGQPTPVSAQDGLAAVDAARRIVASLPAVTL